LVVVAVNLIVVAWFEAEILWVFAPSGVVVLIGHMWRERADRRGTRPPPYFLCG
jgi:hypothetical protein